VHSYPALTCKVFHQHGTCIWRTGAHENFHRVSVCVAENSGLIGAPRCSCSLHARGPVDRTVRTPCPKGSTAAHSHPGAAGHR
jgi:hypothetical protein